MPDNQTTALPRPALLDLPIHSTGVRLSWRPLQCHCARFIETAMTNKLSDEVRENWIKGIPLRRSGKPDDVANIAIFLASELSSYVTGQVISVDGGMHM